MSSQCSAPVPPVVYVPCGSIDDAELDITVRPTRDGQRALLVYSALDRLLACCGEDQPWVLMPTANLDRIGEHVSFDMIVFDLDVPAEQRWKAVRGDV